MFQLVNGLGRLARQVFHRVGIAQPVAALDGVIHVPLPVVRAHVRQRGSNAALCGNRMRAGREDLGDAGRAQPLFGHAERGAQTGTPGPDNNHVVFMRFGLVSSHVVLRSRW